MPQMGPEQEKAFEQCHSLFEKAHKAGTHADHQHATVGCARHMLEAYFPSRSGNTTIEHGPLARAIQKRDSSQIAAEDTYLFQTKDSLTGKTQGFLLALNTIPNPKSGQDYAFNAAALSTLREQIKSRAPGEACFGIIMARSKISFTLYRPELDR